MKSARPKSARTIHVRHAKYPLNFRLAADAFRAEYVAQALKVFDGNVSRTARELGITRRALQLLVAKSRTVTDTQSAQDI
ncbi:MAG: hypothetical protein IPH10_08715 [bacterium]|nr:hypothetical protein [bacterium]